MDEAMRKAVESGDEELIPASRSDADLQDEMNARSCKAGLTNRQGECNRASRIIAQAPNDRYGKNYVRIFGHD